MEFLATSFGKVLDVMVEPVKRQLGYLCNYGSNVQELRRREQELQRQRDSVMVRVREAERNSETIHNLVTDWLTRTDEKIVEIMLFQNDRDHLTTGCSDGSFPNLKLRHKLGRKAKKMISDCDNLLQQSNFAIFSYRPEPEASNVALYDNGYEPFKSRDAIVEEVMKALRDSSIRMIGIYGQGGVGKTTLVKAVARKAKAENLFKVVVMANITGKPDTRKIQGEMADMLGLRLKDESEIGRAGRLKQRLKKEESTLVILDDLWAGLDLSTLGIQFKDDDINQISMANLPNIGHDQLKDHKMSSDSKRLKILLTSRHKEVLSSEMEVKDSIFTVNIMEEDESEKLFNKVVGITDEDSELKSLSSKIVHRCANLPLALVAAGKALKNNKNKVAWENALQRLEKQEMTEVLEPVEFSTMLSYDRLQSEELKSIFLLCARLGKDPSIMYLVKHCIGLSIFQVNTIKEVRDRTNESIKKLKNASLLLDSNFPDCVTMHDMTRDAALSIAYKQKNVFTQTYVKLDEWPDKDAFDKYTVISLHYCDIIDGIPESINCPSLRVFHLDSKDPSVKIPDKVFEGMKELRVLILTGIDLSSFPSSVKCLIKLRMLCLEQCVLGDNISIIGELKNLRILSLLGSKFELFPSELRQLGMLQLFDISSCAKLKEIPRNVISKLNSLEELYMGRNMIQWGIEGKEEHDEIATLAELRYLQQLRILDIHIQDITTLPGSLFFDRLDSYKIVIGDSKMLLLEDFQMPYQCNASRVLALHLKRGSGIHLQMGIKMLFKSIEQLFLGEVDCLQRVTYELNVEGFPNLKHLTIRNNSSIQNIIYSTEWEHEATAFPKLESMCLYKLESLEKICNCQLTNTSFRSLKIIKIKVCSRLKYLFSSHMARLLTELETLDVSACHSLEDIVVVERQENIGNDTEDDDDEVSFPQLRYLTLKSLSELTCFCANEKMISISKMESVTDFIPLFNTKVFVPSLEILDLSSIHINKLWGDQPLPRPSFQNLAKLNVNDCSSLKYLFPLSMVGNLVKLQSLIIRGCDMMTDIFDPEDISADEASQVDVFPQLKEIKVTNMEELKTIWHGQASINSFCSLESLIIEGCHKLVTIFPPYMVGRFHNLGILEVNDCELVEEIFDFQSTPQIVGGRETNLRVVKLESLPKLKHIWNKDPQGLLSFQILQDVEVYRCPSLENLFPFSVANDLLKLERLQIFQCYGMKEIVARSDASNRSNFMFEFPKLTRLSLIYLPELRCFCQGTHTIELQALTCLNFGACDKLEAFDAETTHSETKPVLSSLVKVISNLEELGLYGLKEMKWLQGIIGNNVYLMQNVKELSFFALSSIKILYWFLQRSPNLESLNVRESIINDVLPDRSDASFEKIGTVVQLKNMYLEFSDIPLNIGFENGTILQRVEKLCIEECLYTTNIIPSSIELTHLSYLEVSNCSRLRNLLTPSAVKSLVQLTIMKVSQCARVEEIVTVQENEEEKEDEIVFGKLRSLELVSLGNLTRFCNSQSKLVFRFPSLEEVKVSDCLKLEKFSERIMSAPNLEKVYVVEGEEGNKWYWEGDLNATMQKIFTDKVFFEFCQNLKLCCHPELQQLWRGEISPPENCFNNLRTLIVKNCSFVSEVFPSRLLPYFRSLEELQVSSSPVEVIFDIDGNILTQAIEKHFDLKRMTLDSLQNLNCIWSKDPRSTSFRNLKEMVVTSCGGIKTLFPASLAINLVRLKKLEIGQCDALEEIVGEEEAVADGASRKFEFHYLTTLSLYDLPSLKFFYPGRYTLEFLNLEILHVYNCSKLDKFASDFQSHQGAVGCEDEANITTGRQSLVMAGKVIPNLGNLTLDVKDMKMLSHGHFPNNLLHKLKFLELSFGDCNEAGATLPFKFLEKVPNLESLMISNFNSLEEMFPSQRPEDIDHIICILAQVRQLLLDSLPLLSSIGLDNSWIDPVVRNLRVLNINYCPRLTILVPSSAISFCNLEKLKIRRCHGLVSLFSSSVAKSLVQLQRMEISDCRSITQIVNHETDDESASSGDEIIFEMLQLIDLSYLPSLVSFFSGNATLKFSGFLIANIEQCPKMKCFSQGVVRAPNFIGIREGRTVEDNWHNYGDPNTAVQKLFDVKFPQYICGVQHLKLGDYPDLDDIWHGAKSVPNGGFSKLKTLIVDGCGFLSHYVIPFHLASFLSNLEELQVRHCYSVKAIFEIGPLSCPFHVPLKTLTLEKLFDLENVWNEDPEKFPSFQSLQRVCVNECRSLKSLFPTSICHGKLESLEFLDVRNCVEIAEIVANDETALRGRTTSNSIMFPSLTMLHLWNLPKLKCFYSGPDNLEWPKLKIFNVYHCDQLRIFRAKACDHAPIDVGDIVSFEKNFPDLEQLSLNKADIVNINWQGMCLKNFIQRVKFLILQCFHEDSDGFPFELFRKDLLPNLEKLRVACSKFKEIFSSQRHNVDLDNDMFPHLKGLELYSLLHLESIGLEQSWVSPILEKLETLDVQHCHRLRSLVRSDVSFSKLRELRVFGCQGLVYLFTLSTARSLVLLERLFIECCGFIQEIVSKEEVESDKDDITFMKLKSVLLESLQMLGSFHSGNSTLNFPCLELVIVHQCPRMRIFSDGVINSKEHLLVTTKPPDNVEYRGMGLNTSTQLIFFSQLSQYICGVQHLKLRDYPELEDIWHGAKSVPNGGFSKLKTLIVDGCGFLSHYVIPFHLAAFLSNLEELQVRHCYAVKAIFEIGPLSCPFHVPLKALTLEKLFDLENVWNEDPEKFPSFQSLQRVCVDECRSLKSLFPTSICHGKLESLEFLDVRHCVEIAEIVANDETTLRGRTTSNSIMFPSLTTLHLWNLPKLKCFYSGPDDLEWPKLKIFNVYHCDQLRIFRAKACDHAPIDVGDIVSFEKNFPDLEQLSLNKADIENINWQGMCLKNFIQRVKFLILQCFHEDSDGFPFELFRKESLPNLEKLRVACSKFKEIFSSQRHNVDLDNDMFPHLKGLELYSLLHLESIGLEQSWVSPILENLETFEVWRCDRLRSLVRSDVSFSKLRELRVFGCQGLVYLFTLSTARSLVLLERLSVTRCGFIQEIVSKEVDESHKDGITFMKLKSVHLESLQMLGSFHSGNSTLNFPCLEVVFVLQCPKMRIFSDGVINSKERLLVKTKPLDNVEYCGMGLNTSIQLIFSSQLANFVRNASYLMLSHHPELQVLWEGIATVPDRGFSNLKTLTVDGCQSLTRVIPSHLVILLCNLKWLVVRNCNAVKAIFDVGPMSSPVCFPLESMTLEELPNLEQIWNDPQEILSFQSLQCVYINGCRSLKSLFPVSRVQCKLESLEILRVECCEGLIEIVGTEETASEGATKTLISFPNLNKLKLRNLPDLRCIYDGLNNLMLNNHVELQGEGVTPVLDRGFSNLMSLTVDRFQSFTHVIPSHLVPFLCNLKRLKVRNCNAVKAIFDVGPMSSPVCFPLESMTLEELPNLEQIWSDPQEILSFQSLQLVCVNGCRSLKCLFPASMVQCKLESLKMLRVECCEGLIEIVGTEETASEGATKNLISFPNLNELKLCNLPDLRCTYDGLNDVGCPNLKKLDVFQCGQLKNVRVEGSDDFAIITLEKVYPMIWQPPFPLTLIQRAKFLKLQGCDDSDVFPYGFFERESLPHVEKLAVSDSNFKQIFTSERSDLDGYADNFLTQLKALELISLPKLISIGLEHTHLLGNLETLKLTRCPCLINLSPSTVTFSSLRRLVVSSCDGLLCLFTSSTAKNFVLLEELSVWVCESMQELVAKGDDESDQDDEITFGNLKTLDLDCLPSLVSFYSGTCRLNFPCLEQVSMYDCNQMKVFSNADIYTPDNVTIDSDHDLSDMLEKAFKKAT